MIRSDRALVGRRHAPNRPWTDIIHEHGYLDQAHFIQECRAFARFARARGQGGDENDAAQTGIITAGTASGPMAWFGKIIAISPIWVRRTHPHGP
jgi:hypothetical protein